MKKLIMILGLFLMVFSSSFGQKIHTPQEMMDLIRASKLLYGLIADSLDVEAPERPNYVTSNKYFRVNTNGTVSYKEYNEDVSSIIKNAEALFDKNKYKDVRDVLFDILEDKPKLYIAMTYIGRSYALEEKYQDAEEWLKKSVGFNYLDFEAHRFLADVYYQTGEFDKATDHITTAHILNRNDSEIVVDLKKIYSKNDLKYPDWFFNPPIKIDSVDAKTVNIKADSPWGLYCLTKAFWMYEPGYKESMEVKPDEISTKQFRECIYSLVLLYDKTTNKLPEIDVLVSSIKNEMLEEYFYFESVLPNYPRVAFQLQPEFLEDIKEYVLEIRCKED